MTMEAFSDMKTPVFVFEGDVVVGRLRQLAAAERPAVAADRATRYYYQHATRLLWIDTGGADQRADTLLAWLHTVGTLGFTEHSFSVDDIERDLHRLRTLDVSAPGQLSELAARLEYRLTRAYLRYAYGQRYGFVSPHRLFNKLDVEREDTVRHIVNYRQLFNCDMDVAPARYDSVALSHVADGTLGDYLRSIQPGGGYYRQLADMLGTAADDKRRRLIMVNMERARWRMRQPIPDEGKRVIVNVPAYHLYAYGADSVLDMRVVCGAQTTKTPLLNSAIQWMEVNPQWVIPKSILEKDVIRHIGDSAYFARNRYLIFERATNKPVSVRAFTRQMLLSGQYRVAQQSGSDNSLGRIVFRFPNPFQVFLHYTSNPSVFQRDARAVSHGCVRVAKPFELAQFVLDAPDEWLLDRIRISMDMKPETDRGRQYLHSHADETEHKLISYVPVKPHVPIYIIYQTLWTDERGMLRSWPDVYGYDRVMWDALQPYMQ